MDQVSRPARHPRRRGMALVMVMLALMLAVGMAVAMLSLARTERQSASTFMQDAQGRHMAENVIGIVQAQINHATTRGQDVAWASQPGMIRTYNADGALLNAYKLYSAATLTLQDPSQLNEDRPPSGWAGEPAHWVDLNASGGMGGQQVFPILDPTWLSRGEGQRPKGFNVSGAPGATTEQPAPMPVRWLYVLKDGQIVAPAGSGTTAAVTGASETNPIVGRIAFWTDDDSCRVNVNTAGVGSYWDTPHFYTTEERKFASSQPVNGEFQRYPGHPGTTSLSAVFPWLSDEQLLSSLTPRYQWGGSLQGAKDTYLSTGALNGAAVADNPLYTDTDEIIFEPSQSTRVRNDNLDKEEVAAASFFLTTDSEAPEINLFNLPRVVCWPLSVNAAGRTVFDNVIAFAGTVGGEPYYFQRSSAMSPTADTVITRNQQLFGYLQYLTEQTVPGFGVELAGKYGVDRDQILTEIWDYIRCTNLYDSRLPGTQFTNPNNQAASGYGYVVPLVNGTSRGLGRAITISELAFVFICTADSVDTQFSPPDTSANSDGMLGSNNAATNLTLNGTQLATNERRIQMMIVPEFFSPSLGNVAIRPKNVRLTIGGLGSMRLDGQALFSTSTGSLELDKTTFNGGHHRRFMGGAFDYRAALRTIVDPGLLDSANQWNASYPFISNFVTVAADPPANPSNPGPYFDPGTMTLTGGQLTVQLESSEDGINWITLQSIPIDLPVPADIPIPNLVRTGTNNTGSPPTTAPQAWWSFSMKAPVTTGAAYGRLGRDPSNSNFPHLASNPGYYGVTGGVALKGYNNSVMAGTLFREAEDANYYTDVVRSMAIGHGDTRLTAALASVPAEAFTEVGDWGATGAANALIHTLGTGVQSANTIPGGSQQRRHYVTTNPVGSTAGGAGGYTPPDFRRDTPGAVTNALLASGDFDTGTSYWPDGPYINKPDEGNIKGDAANIPYYDNTEQEVVDSAGFFSPNRIMAGPGMFGSLPTHVQRYAANPSRPEQSAWRTLLFRHDPGHPDAAATDGSGLPTGVAPDHLLMDLFWMPTVEPYAISGPFATAGKINMNYQIQPFTYITRQTGLYAALEAEKIPAVSNDATTISRYKISSAGNLNGLPTLDSLRLDLDVEATLQQFDTRFASTTGRLFLSPTELCDLWLVPQGSSLSTMQTFWNNHRLTGDNMRERPYATIIPRLTTKSNTFTVYYRVQSLKVPPSTAAGTWDETQGTVTSEYRGSTTLQRFIDMGNAKLQGTDFAVNTGDQPTLETFYRWRVIRNKQFNP